MFYAECHDNGKRSNICKAFRSFNKQFDKVKKYTSKALIKLSKTKPYNSVSNFFLDLANKINFIEKTSELMEIVDLGLDKVIELKKRKI